MYQQFLDTLEKNAENMTNSILEEIRMRPETWHYLAACDEVNTERISQVIKNVYDRLESWLHRNESKNMLFSFYMNLGAQRCQEGIPLEEVTKVLLLIRREIWYVIRDHLTFDDRFPLNQLVEINYYVDLIFVRIIQSTIAGYRNKLAVISAMCGRGKQLPGKAFRI